MRLVPILLALLLVSCSGADDAFSDATRRRNQVANYIDRYHDEALYRPTPPVWQPPEGYPWETQGTGKHPRITKEYFRCKGCEYNPMRVVEQPGAKPVYYADCGGAERHSLPLRNGEEFIYPILIDVLNYVQEQTGHRVVITAGHRCPEHNRYVDPSKANSTSKHMVGAEVSFYVQGMEGAPEAIVELILAFYRDNPKYAGQKEYTQFQRYDKETDVSTAPWYNKEVFVKIYRADEGRDLDNRHPYPYLSIQVRYDRDTQQRVQYQWRDANRNYHRW